MNHYPFVSVIIPTYNRHHVICDTVNHLLKQDYPHYEIIVLDQTKTTPDYIKSYFDKASSKGVRYIYLENPGLANARNIGIKSAKGEIILFVDDDIKPYDKHFIKNHAENYSDPGVAGVGGRIFDKEYPKVENNPKKILKLNRFGTFYEGKNGTVRTEVHTLSGNNMSFRKMDVIKAGLFDTNIIGTEQGEEVTLCFSLIRNGKKLIFDPRAAIYHLALPTGGDSSRSVPQLYRQFSRFHNLTLICLKNRDFVKPFNFTIGRIGSMLRIAFQTRNIKTFYWLPKAMYYGYATYRKKINPRDMIKRVKERFGI